jgi:small-conductance mechanosensitive channel
VVAVIFPLVAQKQENGEPHRHLLNMGLAAVAGVSGLILLVAWLLPEQIILLLFGPAYLAVAPSLWQYALATTLYALGNVFVTYHLALGEQLGSYLTVAAGMLQIVILSLFHDSLTQVIWIQVGLMGTLLALQWIWSGWRAAAGMGGVTVPQFYKKLADTH